MATTSVYQQLSLPVPHVSIAKQIVVRALWFAAAALLACLSCILVFTRAAD